MKKNNFSSIESIIKDAKQNKMFILVDDEKRENEGDLIIPSSCANTKNINFMAKNGRGLICLAMDSIHCLLYTSPSPRDLSTSRMPSSA